MTRQGVHVDRIACAWLIRRFIDERATFKFVPPRGYTPETGELRFGMFKAEFTHEGDRCSFEALLARSGLDDPALTAIAEIVLGCWYFWVKASRPQAFWQKFRLVAAPRQFSRHRPKPRPRITAPPAFLRSRAENR